MKCNVYLIICLMSAFCAVNVVAFPIHRRLKSGHPGDNPQIYSYQKNSSMGFRLLSKKFRVAKFHTDLHSLKERDWRITMQSLNRYQYRRSHSRKVGIPTVQTAWEE
ncbi:MAG: hypothetical protein LBC30_04220 [Puniceicoccales bacterium]|jgi:hypothetical protein|nr:hypothetical protein [Puniceicoccales bacterium]